MEVRDSGASQQCFITSNNIRNEVLVFTCFNFLQMWAAVHKHRHAYNAPRCDVRQGLVLFFSHGKCVLKVTETSQTYARNDAVA